MDYARKHSRYGHRDSTMILVAYRHGLRASELCDLQWHQVELDAGRMHVRRAKNGTPSVHPIRGDEIRALRRLRRENPTSHVFVTERGGPMSTVGFHHLIKRLGEVAEMPFQECTRTCSGMPAGINLLTTAMTRVPSSNTSDTRTSNTRFDTPSFHPTDSETSGGTESVGRPSC